MASIEKLTIRLTKAIADKDYPAIDQIYQEVDSHYHHLQSLDDEQTTSQNKLQKWTTFWEVVCWEVSKARRDHSQVANHRKSKLANEQQKGENN